ncbi:MAG TPA: nucleotidyltransferase domain-containing protein [Candidatus Ornithocaccomicrobium faecavium]|uniref:Nucleotidyltransferase domain-containing protein n=1 Tax=Candidatus Ornithocaccomicrobium faecavium TaxID=2840890 RepID=A0A9D1TED2_9FIRM|nr:nucleotidyltransferase domain-containing protein [Candidatus Ornithocaccomicrobium faecavium]
MALPYTLDQLQARLIPVFSRNRVRRATLFGSYSQGKATAQSDVDLLVDSGLHGLQFFGLLEDVCSSLECKVDLTDVKDVIPNSKIDQEIQRTGVLIYEQ